MGLQAKRAPRELNISVWVSVAVSQTCCHPTQPPPAFLTSSPFPGVTSAFLGNKEEILPPSRVRIIHRNQLYFNQRPLTSPAQRYVGTRRQQPELENGEQGKQEQGK